MASQAFIELFEGDTLVIRYTLTDAKGERVDLTGAAIFSSVFDSEGVVIATLVKTTPIASGIEIQDQGAPLTKGQFLVFYASADSVSKTGNHEVDTRIKFTVPSVRVATLLHEQPFRIKASRLVVP